MAEKKYSTLALLNILKEYSDENHILSLKEIQEHLLNQYDLDLERRTIYSNLDILGQNGFVISRYEDNGKGYFLEEREFDEAEVLLLCNAIHASHFISSKQSDALIHKLLNTQSKYQRKDFKDSVYMPNPQKTSHRELFYTIALVSEAIREKKEIQFVYLKYDKNKELVPRREKPYVVEPRYIVYADSRAYVIVTSKSHDGFGHYRLDRMSQAILLDSPVDRLNQQEDAYEYARNKLFMYAGEMEHVTFLCQESIMDHMIDLFGKEIGVNPQKDNTFAIRVITSRQGAKYLAQQYLDAIEIIEPKDLRKEMQEEIQNALKKYKK